jgi:hypothetical protein
MKLKETIAEIVAKEKAGKIQPMDIDLPNKLFGPKLGALVAAVIGLAIAAYHYFSL